MKALQGMKECDIKIAQVETEDKFIIASIHSRNDEMYFVVEVIDKILVVGQSYEEVRGEFSTIEEASKYYDSTVKRYKK